MYYVDAFGCKTHTQIEIINLTDIVGKILFYWLFRQLGVYIPINELFVFKNHSIKSESQLLTAIRL